MKFVKKNLLFIVAFVLLLSSIIFFIYNIKADSDDNKIGIGYAEITSIQTGTEGFTNDELNYSDTSNYHVTTGYRAGNDSNADNAIVRSFDKITYNFNLGIKNKDELTNTTGLTAYSNKIVLITATVPENVAKYVVFEENGKPGETSHTYEISNISEVNGSKINTAISIYVLGAPNGTSIDPKFEIQESTNTDSNYVVTLGNAGTKHYYRYDPLKDTAYATAADFYNYLPTVVSSTENTNITLSLIEGESQKANYENKTGRFMNYILALSASGDLKGQTMPVGEITLNGSFSQTGADKPIMKPEFARLYNTQKVGEILPTVASSPYSASSIVSVDKYTRNPGKVEVSNLTDNSFTLTIKDYSMSYSYPTANADNSSVSSLYIGTYAITLFSPNILSSTGTNTDVTLSFDASSVALPNGTKALNAVSKTSTNSSYVLTDYNLKTGFYEMDGTTKLSDVNGRGAKSKGSEILYVTEFNYASTKSNEGLKEIIKIDPMAFRFMNLASDKDVDIKLYCGDKECSEVSKESFEVKFIAGDFNAANYTATNYDTLDSRIKAEDAQAITNGCTTVKDNLLTYNSDQIMNLYGGPCIKENDAKSYDRLANAVTSDGKEIILSKLVVQTKKNVKLPDNVRVVVSTKLRVRNVTDISKTYQVTTIATSSDHDSEITYYAPTVVNAGDSADVVTDPNNYQKTNYSTGAIDSSLFGESLKILGFEAKQNITVTNKKKDGKMKTNFNVIDNETIHYRITTNLNDLAQNVGADDAWYIKDLTFQVYLPNTLTYIPNEFAVNPQRVSVTSSGTILEYVIPYSKPNQAIPDIYFDAILTSSLTGNGNPITVTSALYAENINGERNDSLNVLSDLTIYGNGINNMIISLTNDTPTMIEKNSEFTYTIKAYNNTDSIINDYIILNVLPSSGDERGSTFSGKYKVHLETTSLEGAKVLCTKADSTSINEEVLDEETEYTDCSDIFNAGVYKDITAFKITNISANPHTNINDIKVTIKTEDNKYSDVYVTKAIGGSNTYMEIASNSLRYEVINRKISGKVFIDADEDGVQKGTETGLANIPVSLYKIVDDLNQELVKETTTLESGVYTFDNLDKGFYKVRFNYDNTKYDLSLRYAIEDTDRDSDAYKISEGLAEITNKHDPYTHDGVNLVDNVEVKNMDMGLINRKPFSMSIKKYITKVDLNYNGITDTKTYNNESKVLLSVRNSLKATAKVYYGFEIINDSQVAGYVDNIYEDIPEGLIFDSSDPYNEGWVLVDTKLQNTTYQNRLLNPGESLYVQIALYMPSREEAGTFLNKVTLSIKPEVKPEEVKDSNIDLDNQYAIGEGVDFAGLSWHVINTAPAGEDQMLTLLLDSRSADRNGTLGSDVYKWSNVDMQLGGTLSSVTSILEDNVICDDASGLVGGSYGGSLKGTSPCTSGQYVTSKVRLLTESEYKGLTYMNLSDYSFLHNTRSFYLQTAVNKPTQYDEYGRVTSSYVDYIKMFDTDTGSIKDVKIVPENHRYNYFRYVITVNSKYILNY